jgi:hypothetical protein
MTKLPEFPAMKLRLTLLALAALAPAALRAWDYEGHRIVNQLALASLPKDFPAFVHKKDNAERIAFLAGEPDRWRNVPDLPIKQYNGMDHYCDLEQIPLAGLSFEKLPSLRYVFAAEFSAGRLANLAKFPDIDPEKNLDHAREWPGFAPWAITEYYGKLRSAFSYLKALEELGTPEEVANAQANIVYLMGVMGHYVGDCAQPLHTTDHHNGWVGTNLRGYSTWPGIHSWIDGGFIGKAGIKTADLVARVTPATGIALPVREDGRDPMFVAVLDYLLEQHKLVEPLYQLEKAGKFAHGKEEVPTPEGRDFIEKQLLVGGAELAAIWQTAWRNAAPDNYLRTALAKRAGITLPKEADDAAATKKKQRTKKTP